MKRTKRLTAATVCVLVAVLVLSSCLFLSLASCHTCVGEGCAVCCQIRLCENILTAVGLVLFSSAAAFCCAASLDCLYADTERHAHNKTLISLKVKLSD